MEIRSGFHTSSALSASLAFYESPVGRLSVIWKLGPILVDLKNFGSKSFSYISQSSSLHVLRALLNDSYSLPELILSDSDLLRLEAENS